MRILTGIQPSGKLHLGNYFGAMKPMIDSINDQDEIFCFIADYHALTTATDSDTVKNNINNAILDWIACGLDPEKIILYVQSDLPQIAELTWILHTVCPMGLLERATSYKDKIAKGIPATSGLFTYPVLMAADILIMQADVVPVGKDQKQHVEMTRDIAIKFNNKFGETFPLPQEKISKNIATIPGIDGQKMSKSYNNYIPLFDDEKVIRKKIMSIVTDSKAIEDKKDPDQCNIFALYKLVSTEKEQLDLKEKYLQGGLSYGEAKSLLFEAVSKYFRKFWEKRNQLEKEPNFVTKIREKGQERAQIQAQKTLNTVCKRVGLM